MNNDHTFHFTINVRVPEGEMTAAVGDVMEELKCDHNQAMGLVRRLIGDDLQDHVKKTFKPLPPPKTHAHTKKPVAEVK